MDKYEKLAGLTAVSRGVNEALDAARAEVAKDMMPTERKVLSFGGEIVGSCAVSAQDTKQSIRCVVTDYLEFINWCIEAKVCPNIEVPKTWYGRNGFCVPSNGALVRSKTGEVIPGVAVIEEEKQTGGVFSVRGCEVEKVMPLMQEGALAELMAIDETKMLEGGE